MKIEIKKILCSAVALLGTLCVLAPKDLAAQSDRNIVIMIDLSGSISGPILEQERNAARTLLNYFINDPQRPKVAIGTFYEAYNETINASDFARIISNGLVADYGNEAAGTGLFGVLNNMVKKPGPGYTDLGQAITVAQNLLTAAPKPSTNYIVLITDGMATKPGPQADGCPCGCPESYAVAKNVANSAHSAGTIIFPVYFSSIDSATSPDFCLPEHYQYAAEILKNDVANQPQFFFEGGGALTGLFGKVACAISCDDSDPCTQDSCNDANGQCVHTPDTNDADSDGVVNCKDLCQGADSQLGTNCNEATPIGGCTKVGTFTCGPQGSLFCASAVPLDPMACFGCVQNRVTEARNATLSAFTGNIMSVRSFALRLKKLAKKNKKVKKLAMEAISKLSLLENEVAAQLVGIPEVVSECQDTTSCRIMSTATTSAGLQIVASTLRDHSTALIKASKKFKKLFNKKDKAQVKAMPSLYDASLSSLNNLPKRFDLCS